MKTIKKIIVTLLLLSIAGCKAPKNILAKTLASQNENIKRVMIDPKQYELQIIYTQIIRKDGKVTFTDYSYNLNNQNYYYPASTIKFPIAVLALEKLNTIPNTSVNTTFTIEGSAERLNLPTKSLKFLQ